MCTFVQPLRTVIHKHASKKLEDNQPLILFLITYPKLTLQWMHKVMKAGFCCYCFSQKFIRIIYIVINRIKSCELTRNNNSSNYIWTWKRKCQTIKRNWREWRIEIKSCDYKVVGFLISQLELADRKISKAMKELNNEFYLVFIEFFTPDSNMLIILRGTYNIHQELVYDS